MKKNLKKIFAWLLYKKIIRVVLIISSAIFFIACTIIFFYIILAIKNPWFPWISLGSGLATVTCLLIEVFESSFKVELPIYWLKEAEKIKREHPKTHAVLYVLERGHISYLIEWINSFERCERAQAEILQVEKKRTELSAKLREVLLQEGEVAGFFD